MGRRITTRSESCTTRRNLGAYLAGLLSLATLPVAALDFSVSGFGTLGYARSDRSYAYQRFIDDGGTLSRDSLAGLQVDAKFADQFGATLQVKAAPAMTNDKQYEGTVSWAFLSWRPSNDWLIRAGRQRIPLYLYSQSFDVGVTYDFARLPTEMYSISPNNDFDGLSFSKNWGLDSGDLTLDGFWGKSKADIRVWLRDNIPPVQSAGPIFRALELKGGGLALSYKQNENVYRVGVGRVVIGERNGVSSIPTTFPFVTLFPGVGYYQVDAALPGPGIPTISRFGYTTATLGADVDAGSGFRAVGELARTFVPQTDVSTQSTRGYASVLKRLEKWTPYVTYAFLRSQARPLNLHNSVNNTTVPAFVPGAVLINASQRAGADGILAYDQSSWAVGTSYAFSATSKLKAEWMRVRIGQTSSLVDAPPASNIRNQHINVLSVSYNFVF